MTMPTVSADTLRLWEFLPPFVQVQEALNGYLFLQWLEGIGQQQQIIDNLVRDVPINSSPPTYDPGWSVVMDVTRCPMYALPWLAQFVGVRFTGTQSADQPSMIAAIESESNWTRGTPAAILAAVSAACPVGTTITLIERYPDPYSFLINIAGTGVGFTYSQLAVADPTYALVDAAYSTYGAFPTQSIGTLQALVNNVTPAGLIPTVEIVSA